MVGALGINIKLLYTGVFGLGAAMAGFAGMIQVPSLRHRVAWEDVLILAFVVIVIGGIGSIRGAFIAAIIIGIIDTMGRSFYGCCFASIPSNKRCRRCWPSYILNAYLSDYGSSIGL